MIEYDSSSIKNLIQKDSKDLDSADELSGFRSKFVIEDPNLIYLDGNSLGRLPIKTLELVKEIVSEQWGDRLIRSWNERWLEDTTRIGDNQVGAKVLWDLSHSVGVVPVDLRRDEIDLAVGCTYKYLNGGPGAPAFMYVSENCKELINPIAGWYGSEDPFGFDPDCQPDRDNRRFLTGTPPLISTLLIEPGVDLVIEAGVESIRSKSVALSERFLFKVRQTLLTLGFEIASPLDEKNRGSHVSLSHSSALAIGQSLINEQSTIPDVRPPDLVRFGFAPLYTTFSEVEECVNRIKTVIEGGGVSRWENSNPLVP